MLAELGLVPHLHAFRLGACAAFARAGADQLALELSKTASKLNRQEAANPAGVRAPAMLTDAPMRGIA